MTQLAQHTALVTGANRGIGREFVGQLLDRGVAKVCQTGMESQQPGLVLAEPHPPRWPS